MRRCCCVSSRRHFLPPLYPELFSILVCVPCIARCSELFLILVCVPCIADVQPCGSHPTYLTHWQTSCKSIGVNRTNPKRSFGLTDTDSTYRFPDFGTEWRNQYMNLNPARAWNIERLLIMSHLSKVRVSSHHRL